MNVYTVYGNIFVKKRSNFIRRVLPFTIEIAMQDSFLIPHSFHSTKSNIYISVISSEKFAPEKTHFLNFDIFPISFKYRLWTASNRRICFLDVSEIFYSNIKADITHWDDPISKRNLILCILCKKKILLTRIVVYYAI